MNETTQRDAFFTRLHELMRDDKDIVIVSADMGAPSMDAIRRDYPNQFVNAGIAEQNAILLASGLAMSGMRVFAYAIAPFITLRCLEQIRVQSGMMNVPITIVGVGAGFGYEDSGPTHHLLEDLAVLRAFPHVEINSITDAVMARKIAEASLTKETTNYVRLDRKLSADLYTEESAFDDGMCILKDGRDGYIIATGIMTHVALEVSNSLAEAGHDVGVVDLYTLPVNIGNFEKLADRSEFLITMEEHFLAGGLGSAICEALQDIGRLVPVKRIGLPVDRGYCYVYGGRERLRQYYGVGFDQSVETVSQFIGSMA